MIIQHPIDGKSSYIAEDGTYTFFRGEAKQFEEREDAKKYIKDHGLTHCHVIP